MSGDARYTIIWVTAPATATSTGIAGQMAYDANYYYICTAANTWVRTALASWTTTTTTTATPTTTTTTTAAVTTTTTTV